MVNKCINGFVFFENIVANYTFIVFNKNRHVQFFLQKKRISCKLVVQKSC